MATKKCKFWFENVLEGKNMKFIRGQKIRIIKLFKDPAESFYLGKIGNINEIRKDCYGQIQLWGTWGGIALYPDLDCIEVLKDEEQQDENKNDKK